MAASPFASLDARAHEGAAAALGHAASESGGQHKGHDKRTSHAHHQHHHSAGSHNGSPHSLVHQVSKLEQESESRAYEVINLRVRSKSGVGAMGPAGSVSAISAYCLLLEASLGMRCWQGAAVGLCSVGSAARFEEPRILLRH